MQMGRHCAVLTIFDRMEHWEVNTCKRPETEYFAAVQFFQKKEFLAH